MNWGNHRTGWSQLERQEVKREPRREALSDTLEHDGSQGPGGLRGRGRSACGLAPRTEGGPRGREARREAVREGPAS